MKARVTPPHVAGPLRLSPFRAITLQPSRIGAPASARLFARPHRDVARRLRDWERRGMLEVDAAPAVYLHEFTVTGVTIRALVGTIDVSRRAVDPAERAVLPHEGIYPAQADDLAQRMVEMEANPAPILLVHQAPAAARALVRAVREDLPARQFEDRAGHRHRIWRIADEDRWERLNLALAPSQAVIADGHHRYAAYLRLQQRNPGGPADRGLVMLVDQDDTPLHLGAIHRVLRGSTPRDVAAAAASLGIPVQPAGQDGALAALGPGRLVVTDHQEWLVIDVAASDEALDVETLHQLLVPALPHGPSRITYHHTAAEALAHTDSRDTAVLLPAPPLERVMETVATGRLLPEKATSFQPKPAFGVFIRSWRDEGVAPSTPRPRSETQPLHRS